MPSQVNQDQARADRSLAPNVDQENPRHSLPRDSNQGQTEEMPSNDLVPLPEDRFPLKMAPNDPEEFPELRPSPQTQQVVQSSTSKGVKFAPPRIDKNQPGDCAHSLDISKEARTPEKVIMPLKVSTTEEKDHYPDEVNSLLSRSRNSSYRSSAGRHGSVRVRGKLMKMASMPADSEIHEYMDGLAKDPNRYFTPHTPDTGETILHLLAKEGKLEIIQNLLVDTRVESQLVRALLLPDKLGWNPIMASTKADSGIEEMMFEFLTFLKPRMDHKQFLVLLSTQNISKDTLFTLLMRNSNTYEPSRRLLFEIIKTYATDEKMNDAILRFMQQLSTPNSCELTSRTMKCIIDLSNEIGVNFNSLFMLNDKDGNNFLMELAKLMKDDALREVLTNNQTTNFITHSVLLNTNKLGQTLLTLIEVNRESLSESLPLVLKREYGCHRRDMIKTEICLSKQLETSASASEIINELHQLEPKGCCQIFGIWTILFLTSLTPNIVLAFSDIFSDSYLVVEYYSNMNNLTHLQIHADECETLKAKSPIPLKAFAACLDSKNQFWYTITFLLIPLIFYLTEFLTLRPEYEPTGLRSKVQTLWHDLKQSKKSCTKFLSTLGTLLVYVIATIWALILWQPVTAVCKFYRDARYEASEGTTRVLRRKEKRFVDLAASRGELIEVCIEAVFEPMVQGYIIFPSIISIIQRLANSVTVGEDGTLQIEFALKGIETAQIFSIGISMVSLAWCFSEYNSVRKNMLLDIAESPCSRVVMCFFMLLQVIARLLAFMMFTLYWGPGKFYPLMIFIGIHMALSAVLHIIFSEDISYWKKGMYLKFLHNVIMNSFACIYFHNYIRFDEMPITKKRNDDESSSADVSRSNLTTRSPSRLHRMEIGDTKESPHQRIEFIDSQRPGLHISTFLRQTMFDMLYSVEYVVLLAFGFASDVEDLIDEKRRPIFISVILILSFVALGLKLLYYTCLHVWNNVILTGKKLERREFTNTTDKDNQIQSRFFKYVFISRNTWILGSLKHIETTLIVLPNRIIEAIKGRGQDLEDNFTDVTRNVNTTWFSSPKEHIQRLKPNHLILSLLFFPLVILVIVINILIIVLLVVGLILTIPIAVLIFIYNLKNGFRAVDIADEEEGQNTLELPPEVDNAETIIFHSDPDRTLVALQKELEETRKIDLSRKCDYTADEFDVFAMLILSLNRKRYPLKVLNLDNCDISDDKLVNLAPLMIKFEKVTMNGSQKLTPYGWNHLAEVIIESNTCRLKKLELKITKTDDDIIRFRREILLEELKGSSMTAEALAKIATFAPYLEKLCLDDIFNDRNFLDIIKTQSDNIIESWKELAFKITQCPLSRRSIRSLSLPGCAINDDILTILAPALVKVKFVRIGRNPITPQGWLHFKNTFLDALNANESLLTHLSLNAVIDSGTPNSSKLVHSAGMLHLSLLIPYLEEVDLSGQVEVGADGWMQLAQGMKAVYDKYPQGVVKTRSIRLENCKIPTNTRNFMIEHIAKCQLPHPIKMEFGKDTANERKGKCCFG
ncbi:hypothetical protein TCAL_16897 [Tigriopus californicus]|uniref:XK-related protein n=1 Tax=Tigriopus californicus TaxID=6832 RepID=A0A553P7X5_TIGCA|nr:hypothetical protein TCAL_16897 [Tigriopus californicus]